MTGSISERMVAYCAFRSSSGTFTAAAVAGVKMNSCSSGLPEIRHCDESAPLRKGLTSV